MPAAVAASPSRAAPELTAYDGSAHSAEEGSGRLLGIVLDALTGRETKSEDKGGGEGGGLSGQFQHGSTIR